MISNLPFGAFITVTSLLFVGKAKVNSIKIKENIIPPNALSISFNLKSSILTPLFIILIITQNFINLEAKEPTLAILKNIDANDFQRFRIKSSSFICRPYGITTLEQIYKKSPKKSICRENIDKFYAKNRDLLYFSESILKVGQTYHIEFKNSQCLIYAKGQTTLSQILLRKGLGFKKNSFKDEEFDETFTDAMNSAKINKDGLWRGSIQRDCTAEMQK